MLPKLRTKVIKLDRLDGLEVTIRELSGRDIEEIMRATQSVPAWVVKLGVVDWAEHSVEEIEQSVGALTLRDIGTEIYRLTGIDLEKNSVAGQPGASTSA